MFTHHSPRDFRLTQRWSALKGDCLRCGQNPLVKPMRKGVPCCEAGQGLAEV